jgi:hypothetical protein
MNREEKIKNEIEKIRISISAKGWRESKLTQKAHRELVELGLAEYLPWALPGEKCASLVAEVIKAAKQAGGEKVTRSHWNVGGDADVITETTEPSALYLALNEQGEDGAGQTYLVASEDEFADNIAEIPAYAEVEIADIYEYAAAAMAEVVDNGDGSYELIAEWGNGEGVSRYSVTPIS